MRNLVDERPTRDLHGRLAWSRSFVDPADCFGPRHPRHRVRLRLVRAACARPRCPVRHRGRADGGRSRDCARVLRRRAADVHRRQCARAPARRRVVRHGRVLGGPRAPPKGRGASSVREISRVLRPGGVLYLSTPHAALLPKLTDPAWWLIGHRHYSRERLARLRPGGRASRWSGSRRRGRSWEIVQTLDLYVAKWIFRRRPFFEAAIARKVDTEWERPGFSNLFLRGAQGPRLASGPAWSRSITTDTGTARDSSPARPARPGESSS